MARTQNTMSQDEFYDVLTKPTSNEMFDNGAWLAPVLTSHDPLIDPRALRAIHFYPEDAMLSACGHRFGPDHYVETFASDEETRRRCVNCTKLLSAVVAGKQSDNRTGRITTITPGQDVYTLPEFAALIAGTTRVRMRVNRTAIFRGTLYLLVDEGFVPARSLRRDLKSSLARVTSVRLLWAGLSAAERLAAENAEKAERLRVEAAERLARKNAVEEWNQQFAEMLAPQIGNRTPSEPSLPSTKEAS